MAAAVVQDSELALQLQNIVQPKLVEAGWSTGDSTLAEYIVLMLVNGKDKDQVASELANDLLALGPEDESTKEFARWLFEQVALLGGQGATGAADMGAGDESATTHAIPTSQTGDADMGAGMDVEGGQGIPTGPKSMRNGSNSRGNTRRGNHVSRAMDRANDSVLHKVRNNSSERIGRQPPRGPRGNAHGNQFKSLQGMGRGAANSPQMSQQQNQLMQFMNQQMEMMQQMIVQNAPGMMNMNGGGGGGGGAAINPNFRGRSLADRVNGGPRGGGKFGDRKGSQHSQHSHQQQQNQGGAGQDSTGARAGGDTEMGADSVMDTESNAGGAPNAEKTVCYFNLKCTKPDCPFAHQSPAAPPNTAVDTSDSCTYGAACQNRKCVAKHPSPAKRTQFQAEQECKFWPNCTNAHCQFKHPAMPMCRFGGDCNKEDCKFTHVRTVCKYNPCMNPNCYFKHAEGQKKDSKWVNKDKDGDASMDADHVSERKFVSDEGAQAEELIKPDGGNAAAAAAEDVVT